jgi:hypothetical protein
MEWHKGDVRTIWIRSPVTYASMVHSTWPSRAMWRMHAPTFNKWQKKKKTLHMLTHSAMWGCGLTSLVVCINDTFRDIEERHLTIRSEIWTTNICSLGFWDIKDCVTLWRLILWSLGCTLSYSIFHKFFGVQRHVLHHVVGHSPLVDTNISNGRWEGFYTDMCKLGLLTLIMKIPH